MCRTCPVIVNCNCGSVVVYLGEHGCAGAKLVLLIFLGVFGGNVLQVESIDCRQVAIGSQ